jgi:hypothetical protein
MHSYLFFPRYKHARATPGGRHSSPVYAVLRLLRMAIIWSRIFPRTANSVLTDCFIPGSRRKVKFIRNHRTICMHGEWSHLSDPAPFPVQSRGDLYEYLTDTEVAFHRMVRKAKEEFGSTEVQ